MPTLSPRTPADEYLLTFVRHFSNMSLFDTMPTHHPADGILIIFILNIQQSNIHQFQMTRPKNKIYLEN